MQIDTLVQAEPGMQTYFRRLVQPTSENAVPSLATFQDLAALPPNTMAADTLGLSQSDATALDALLSSNAAAEIHEDVARETQTPAFAKAWADLHDQPASCGFLCDVGSDIGSALISLGVGLAIGAACAPEPLVEVTCPTALVTGGIIAGSAVGVTAILQETPDGTESVTLGPLTCAEHSCSADFEIQSLGFGVRYANYEIDECNVPGGPTVEAERPAGSSCTEYLDNGGIQVTQEPRADVNYDYVGSLQFSPDYGSKLVNGYCKPFIDVGLHVVFDDGQGARSEQGTRIVDDPCVPEP